MTAKGFAIYLEAAAAFWKTDYTRAAATFTSLQKAQPAWVRETATYMVARCLINRAQVGAFDEYGSFNKDWRADATIVTEAEASLDKYLKQYPMGTYAQSARGLKRRGYWLARDTTRLQQEYGALLLLSAAERSISDVDLVQEIDNKITTPSDSAGVEADAASVDRLANSTQNPLLLAMVDLQAMRSPAEAASGLATQATTDLLPTATIEIQKPLFAEQMPLYEYLLAVHAFYVDNKPEDVLRLIPDATHQASFTYLQFSRQVLRGMALEAVKDHNALGFWMQMLPCAQAAYQRPALELAIALHEERAGKIRDVFAVNSPVHYPYLRQILLANVADADLLRTQAINTSAPQRERDIALFTLLYKQATRGESATFLKDLALVPPTAPTDGYYALDALDSYFSTDQAQPAAIPLGIFLHGKTSTDFPCPGLRASEQQLVQDPTNATARLCLADFVRLNQDVMYPSANSVTADELGGTPSLFPRGNYVRMDTYAAVLADPKSSRDDKAYALFRAVNC